MLPVNFCELWINSCVWQLKWWKSIWYPRTKVLCWCRDGRQKYCWGFLHSERDIKQCFLSFVLNNSNTFSNAFLSVAKKNHSRSQFAHLNPQIEGKTSPSKQIINKCWSLWYLWSKSTVFPTTEISDFARVYGTWWLCVRSSWESSCSIVSSYPAHLQQALVQRVTAKEDLQLNLFCSWWGNKLLPDKIDYSRTSLELLICVQSN